MPSTIDAIDLPFQEAIDFFRDKASVTTRTWTDVYAAAHSRAFMVAGAATEALVDDFRQSIDKALAEGTTLDEFRRDFDDIVKRHGWQHTGGRNWRSRIIFDTNLRTAYAAGRWAQQTAPATLQAFPFLQYNHSGAVHPRLDHLAWDGMVLEARDTFWITNYPPNGWHCGCFATSLSQRDLGRQGKAAPDPSPDLVFRAEEVGGRTVRVPNGVDPGFEYNPGLAWRARTLPGRETVAAAPGMIRRFVEGALAGSHPDKSWIPVATAPNAMALAQRLPARTEMRLSAETIRSHQKHPIGPDQYAAIPEWLVEDGTLIERQDGRLTLVGSYDGQLYSAGVKIVGSGRESEIYLLSLRRTNAGQIARYLAGGRSVFGK